MDPSGEDIVLTGGPDKQREGLERWRRLLGEERWNLVDFNQRNIEGLGEVTVIDFGTEKNRLNFEVIGRNAGELEFSAAMSDLIGSKQHIEYQRAESFTYLSCLGSICEKAKTTPYAYGGAATLNRDESLAGNVQIWVGRSATDKAEWVMENRRQKGVKTSSDGGYLSFTKEQVDGHELGHAWSVIRQGRRAEDKHKALRIENILRDRQGSPNRRLVH